MSNFNITSLKKHLPFLLLALTIVFCGTALADVGNQNRYVDTESPSGSGDFSDIIAFLIGLCFNHPALGITLLVIVVIFYFVSKRKSKNPKAQNKHIAQMADTDFTADNTAAVAASIQAADPDFAADKFIGFAREVFMTIQQAWTAKDWKPIRPFESETLFNTHKQQLDEFIRLGRTNVLEKIGIKHCSLNAFRTDGDKEVLTVWLNAVMRDYVIDDNTKKVIESDPERDWYMRYELVFCRKAGVKTDPGKKGTAVTNCPNCGAPTEITSSGQCSYCGSVITNGEHDWVLTDIHTRN